MVQTVIRVEQIGKMVQKEIGMLFLTETKRWLGHVFISVTTVNVSGDLSLAKVYLSFCLNKDKDQERLLKKINDHKHTIKRLLGKRMAGKIYKIPHLKFILDHSVGQGARVTALIDQLNFVEP
ncbi:Ribosome-binding factor A [Cardinium endosymbiont cEper1 of Encarsia pergandiella]|uniref:30S ribosome-binding factor RbfA n=1 Tax=Cardinium endosymbiont of Encarsia pergandiella TaxID=249402 RepID=UPI00027EA8EF|nr:30S ribosome-binding factor RbfA [Cardinium endosymbiont of Encarsia pergandiella]CCM09843.1 Ribosome-binding factor A [Cardinium endosymbiont cEper1 of Encarsia pergandiella]